MHLRNGFKCLTSLVILGSLWGCSGGSGDAILGGGTTLEVGPNGGYSSLGSALGDAKPGDTITVNAGSLSEQVVVEKSVRIVASGTTLSQSGPAQAFSDDSSDSSTAVLIIRNTSNVEIVGMSFSGPQDGIQVRNSSNVSIRDVDASGNGDDGIDIRGSSNVFVSGKFENNGDRGVQIREGSSGVRIEGASLVGNVDDGLRARESSGVVIDSVDASGNGGDGVEVREVSGSAANGSTITGNAEYGLRIRDSGDFQQSGNTIDGNTEGNIRND